MIDRPAICRQLLEHVAHIARLRVMRDELRAMGHHSLAWSIPPVIRLEHMRINELQQQLGLDWHVLASDAAAFARAQLGLPIDAPVAAPRAKAPRRPSNASWMRDLAVGVDAA